MRLSCLFVLAMLCLNSTLALSATIVRTHSGATDPLTESWTRVPGSTAIPEGPVIGDTGGFDAWNINDNSTASGSGLRYEYILNGSEFATAEADGWKLSARVRAVTAGDSQADLSIALGFDFGPTKQQYIMTFGADALGDQIVRGLTDIGTFAGTDYESDGSGNVYHLYEMIYDPVANSADIFVDGVERISNYAGFLNNGNPAGQFYFGSRQSGSTGNGNYNFVQFTLGPFADELAAVPEPSTLALLGLALPALSARRNRRNR